MMSVTTCELLLMVFLLEFSFSVVLPPLSSIHISAAAVSDGLPQHLPNVHHGEHTPDHPERLHHLAADAGPAA